VGKGAIGRIGADTNRSWRVETIVPSSWQAALRAELRAASIVETM